MVFAPNPRCPPSKHPGCVRRPVQVRGTDISAPHGVPVDLLDRLVAPPLTPIRRHLPLMGGVDLSPLVLLVLLQIANLVMLSIQAWVLAWV